MPAPDRVWLVNHDPSRLALARRLRTGDAVVIGLGSMIGAGVFAAFAPAAGAAGAGLLVGLAVAGLGVFAAGIAYRGWRLRSAAAWEYA
jgi:amino acid transporter